jgi:hypothetical protein
LTPEGERRLYGASSTACLERRVKRPRKDAIVKLEHDHEVDAAHMYLDSETVRPKKTYGCDPQEVDGQIQLG